MTTVGSDSVEGADESAGSAEQRRPPDRAKSPGRLRLGRVLNVSNQATSTVVVVVLAVLISIAIGALILLADGRSPVAAASAAWDGAVGDADAIGVTLNRATIFLLAGLGFVVAFRSGLLNIGQEGQIYLGAAGAGAVAIAIGSGLQPIVALPLALLAAAVAGGLLSLLAGALYVWRGVSIVLSTLLLNFVAFQFVSYIVRSPNLLQENPEIPGEEGYSGTVRNFPQSDQIDEAFRFPTWFEPNDLHMGIFLAVACAGLVVFFFRTAAVGFEFRVIGLGSSAATQAGISVAKNVLLSMFLAGALAGLAGASLVMGDRFRVLENISPGYGFIAILAALLVHSSPGALIVGAFLFAALQRGGQTMEASGEAPEALVFIIQGVVVVLIASAVELERRWDARRDRQKVA